MIMMVVVMIMMINKLLIGIFALIQFPNAKAFSPKVIETARTPLVQI
jgi:hypothetical protein